MTHNSTQPVVINKRRSSVGNSVGLVLALLLLVVPGVVLRGFAEKHKPSVSNFLANGGDILTPSAYQGIHAIALLMLIGGSVIALVCLMRMTRTPVATVAPQYPAPPAHLRHAASPAAAARPFPAPAPEARQPAPAP